MSYDRLVALPFVDVHGLYVAKAERKNRTRAEVDDLITWLTGYDEAGLARALAAGTDVRTFVTRAPAMNPATARITGVVCGVRVEEIDDPLVQRIRWLDKLVDELARGRSLAAIRRET